MQIVKNRFIFIAISLVLILGGFVAMIINASTGNGAFRTDVSFSGGTSIEVKVGKAFDNAELTKIVTDATGEKNPQVQKVGDGLSATIKTKSLTQDVRTKLQDAIAQKYGLEESNFSIQDVSATVSSEMVRDSIFSVIVACIAMLIYVSIRFKDFSMGASSIIALCHDALIVVGSYAVLRIPLSNSFIAAILTVLGYSINATIVIFDRIRENRSKLGRNNYEALVDTSVKQTLTRSLFTSLTTFFTVACLYVLGVESVRQFVLPIAVGIVCGTYSSICIAGNIWYIIITNLKKNKAVAKNSKK